MKRRKDKKFYLFWILFLTAGFFIFPEICLANEGKENKSIIINEIMWAGSDEWIELKNISNKNVDISEWIVIAGGKSNKDLTIPKNEKYIIEPNSFFIIPNDLEDKDKEKVKISLLDNGKRIALEDDKKEEVDETTSKDSASINWPAGNKDPKLSMERSDDLLSWHNYYKISDSDSNTGTPGEGNSEKPKPKVYSDKIRINEILPNPNESEDDEFIELYNESGEKIDLENWILKDASKTGKYAFPKDSVISTGGFLVIYKKDYKFSLNNSGEEDVVLLDPNEKEVDKISYSGSTEGASYNYSSASWRWSRFLTQGEENQFNNLPGKKVKIEKKVYKNMSAEFQVKAADADGDVLKFTWDFGDGHKSYVQNPSHKYEKTGTYHVSLKIFDGSEETLETFEIDVGKFPDSKVKIVGVKANPKGKDSDLETIKIKNTSKQKINLKDWSVATGWNELYNHPIGKKFILKQGETKELTRKYSAFTLNNKQVKIELRRPDGSVASKVKYSKKEGVQDDEVYAKTESGWEWQGTQTNADVTQTVTDATQITEEMQANTDETPIDTVENKNIENDSTESSASEKQNDETNDIIQTDEPKADGEVLGAETENKNNQTSGDKLQSGNLAQRIFWIVNQEINSAINFIVSFIF